MRSKVHRSDRPVRWHRSATVLLAVAASVGAAACGSTSVSSSGTTADTAASSSAGVAQATAAAQRYEQLPATFGITTPTAKPIPSGKRIVYIYCGVPQCQVHSDGIKRAAAVLGWQFTEIPSQGTPASVKSAWDTAVRMHPDAVIGAGFNIPAYASELKQLKSMGTYVANIGTTDPGPTGGVDMRIAGPDEIAGVGTELAAWVVSQTKGKADTLYVDVPAFEILKPAQATFTAAYHRWCPGCQLSTLDLPITAVGTTSVQTVVSYLRAHPSINFVVFNPEGGVDNGLPAALRAAGLSNVKFAGNAGSVTNLSYIQSGEETATINEAYYEGMAALVDGAARYVTHQSLAPDIAYRFPLWITDKANLQSTTGFPPVVPNLYAQLSKLWNK